MTTAPLAPTLPPGSGLGPDPDARHPVLVTPQWLRDHLDDPAVLPIEIDVSPRAHTEWHIPGAVLWDAYAELKDADYRPVPTSDIERLIERSGVRPGTTVVCYGYASALGCWLLRSVGQADVRILDCSRDTWQREGHPVSTAATERATVARHPLPAPDSRLRADRGTVQAAIGSADTTILDVRSTAEYAGECFWPSGGMDPSGRAGHVPTAVHRPLDGVLDDRGAFRDTDTLRRVLDTPETVAGRGIITYCTIGGRAATAWFILTHLLGHDGVRVYDGSWAEWGRLPDTPVS